MGFGRPRGNVPGKSNLAGGDIIFGRRVAIVALVENIKDADAFWNAGARFGDGLQKVEIVEQELSLSLNG